MKYILLAILVAILVSGCDIGDDVEMVDEKDSYSAKEVDQMDSVPDGAIDTKIATFAGGCFWCVESDMCRFVVDTIKYPLVFFQFIVDRPMLHSIPASLDPITSRIPLHFTRYTISIVRRR